MTVELSTLVTATYAVFSALRVLFYVPQIVAIAKENSPVHAISLTTWGFWSFSHAVTSTYAYVVANDALLGAAMSVSAMGSLTIVLLTMRKRCRYG